MGVHALRLLSLLLAAGLAGCAWPRDPGGTKEHVAGHVLRAGVSENPPWIRFAGNEVNGLEADMIRAVARDAGAQVQWVKGGESQLMPRLKARKLDLVAGGVTTKSPWAKELGATRPYATVAGEKHVLLAPPGENAWLLALDQSLSAHRSTIEAAIAETSARR